MTFAHNFLRSSNTCLAEIEAIQKLLEGGCLSGAQMQLQEWAGISKTQRNDLQCNSRREFQIHPIKSLARTRSKQATANGAIEKRPYRTACRVSHSQMIIFCSCTITETRQHLATSCPGNNSSSSHSTFLRRSVSLARFPPSLPACHCFPSKCCLSVLREW